MIRARVSFLAAALLLSAGHSLSAQAWDAPGFLPPAAGDRIGVYLVLPENADFGIVGTLRQAGFLNLGVRGGFMKPESGSARVFIGSDAWGPLVRHGDDSPFDVAWTAGVGATFGSGTFARFPVGLSIGRAFGAGGLALIPYVHPRLAFQVFASDGNSDSSFRVGADLGLDLELREAITLRSAVALDKDGGTVGLGVAWRAGGDR